MTLKSPTRESSLDFALGQPEIWLSAVTFPGRDLATPPTRCIVHVTNATSGDWTIEACQLWLPESNSRIHVFRSGPQVRQLAMFPADGRIAPHAKACLVAECAPLPLGYAVVEVKVLSPAGAERSVWAHVRVKPEVFDISGGWVASDVGGRNSLTIEPYLKTLHRMHINTGHIGLVPGYTDNADLYEKYPLKYFNRLEPFAQFDNDAVLPRIHAVEFLGEPQYGGGRPVPPQEVWRKLAPYQTTRLPTTVTHSEERIWRYYAGLSDFPHFDAYRVTAPAADSWTAYDRWNGRPIRWGAPLETIGDMTRSLRELNRPRPIACWSQGAHAGWGRSRGRSRSSPTPDELRAQAYHALGNRVTSLYWFNLSLKSLTKFPDLIEPITRVNREIRLIDQFLLEGDACAYRRESKQGRLDWDLTSIAGPDTGLFFANDLAYEPDVDEGVFRFGAPRPAEFRFSLPAWLRSPAEVFRVDADGLHEVPHEIRDSVLVIRDSIAVVGIYVAAREPGARQQLQQEYEALRKLEDAMNFDPGNVPSDAAVLRQLLEE